MDVQDLLFSPDVDLSTKQAFLHSMDANGYWEPHMPIFTRTATNDDVNGSQHATNGGTDFTYRDAELNDVQEATTLGFYEYFSHYSGQYTGHYYQGDGNHFPAFVIDPPSYAVDETL